MHWNKSGCCMEVSVQAHAGDRAVIGAVEGALVGAHFGGGQGAVAGAILGAALGSASESNHEQRTREPARYAPAPTYYEPRVSYQPRYCESYREPYYEPYREAYCEPRRVVYVQPRVYSAYPTYHPAPVYVTRYAGSSRGHYRHRHDHRDYRGRY